MANNIKAKTSILTSGDKAVIHSQQKKSGFSMELLEEGAAAAASKNSAVIPCSIFNPSPKGSAYISFMLPMNTVLLLHYTTGIYMQYKRLYV